MTIDQLECFLFSFLFPDAGAHLFLSSTDSLLALAILAVLLTQQHCCCHALTFFAASPISQSTAILAIDMAPSPICHSTASLAIDMAPSGKEVLGVALSNAKAIDMSPSDKEVLGNALSNAKIPKKPSPPSSSVNIDGTSDKEARLGIPIFGSNFWDPHCKRNSDSVFDSEDSGRKIFFEFRCLESQKIGIPIPKFEIPVPHKKTYTYSSVDTKVHRRKPLPYKTAGELFFPPNLHLLTLIGKQTYIYSHLTENEQ
jgi:hypothetical protein